MDLKMTISDLKLDPLAILAEGNVLPVAITDQEKIIYYAVPAKTYEKILDEIDEISLIELVKLRLDKPTYQEGFDLD